MTTGSSGSVSMQVAVYTADGHGYPQNLVGLSAVQLVNTGGVTTWVTFAIPGSPALTAGVNYCLCLAEPQIVSGSGANVGAATSTDSNEGQATFGGSLAVPPSAPRFGYGGYWDLKADYCASNPPTPTFTNTPTVTPTSTNTPVPFTPTDSPTVTDTFTPTVTPTSTVTPVVCTPTVFGDSVQDTSFSSAGDFVTVFFSNYSCPVNATLRDVEIYMETANPVTIQTAVYTESGGYPTSLVGVSAQTYVSTSGAVAWVTVGIPGNQALTAGTSYSLCVCFTGGGGGLSPSFGTGHGGTNFGSGVMTGGSLANPFTSLALVANYLDIRAGYCP